MKKMFTVILISLYSICYSQNARVTIDTIINVPILSQDSIYDVVEYYLATVINDSRSAIEMKSKSSHIFVVNPVTDVEFTALFIKTLYQIRFKMDIMIKDGRIRIKTSDHKMISGTNSSGTSMHAKPTPINDTDKVAMAGISKKTSDKWKKQIMDATLEIISNLSKSFSNNTSSDW